MPRMRKVFSWLGKSPQPAEQSIQGIVPEDSQVVSWDAHGVGQPSQPRPPTRPETFRAGRAPRPNDVFIAVMGVTGSGKSSFISLCRGEPVEVGRRLEACTTAVTTYAYDISPACTVYLIDTPGFDGTNRSDSEVLSEIATWLADSYQNHIRLHGIIFLHRITDNRLQGAAKRTLMMFRQLCGPEALKRVILVTTMWDSVVDNIAAEEAASTRETLLIDTQDLWGWMVSQGSLCRRHHNTAWSARAIVDLLASHDEPVVTDLQRQLVDEHRPLDETGAGSELEAEMRREREKWKQERRQIEQDVERATGERSPDAERILLREERDRYTAKISEAEENTRSLQCAMENLRADTDQRVTRMENEMREQAAAHREELEQLSRDAQQARRDQEKRLERKREECREKRREIDELKRRVEQLTAGERPEAGEDRAGSQEFISFAMGGASVACLNQGGVYGNWVNRLEWPKVHNGSAWLKAVSFGYVSDDEGMWIAKYSDGSWHKANRLGDAYPELGKRFSDRGARCLEYCVLGPESSYYARWNNGRAFWDVSTALSQHLNAVAGRSDGGRTWLVALGRGGAWVTSYGVDRRFADTFWDLRGNYTELEEFLRDDTMHIDAITLNQWNNTDFILSYRRDGQNQLYFKWFCSDDTTRHGIATWASGSGRERGTCGSYRERRTSQE